MESQQSTAEPDEGKKDQDISHLSEQHDASSNAPREKSTLAQVIMPNRNFLPLVFEYKVM